MNGCHWWAAAVVPAHEAAPHDAPEQISRTTIPRTIAGWLTAKVVKGRGYGAFRDIILGIVGAFIGGMVMSLFGVQGQAGFMGSIMIAFAGATILVAVVRTLGI